MRWPHLFALILLPSCVGPTFSTERPRVPRKPPGVTIRAPADGAIFFEHEDIPFEGRLFDPTGGISDYEWSSNLDGVLAAMADTPLVNGDALTSARLSAGTHKITLWAVDWNEMDAEDTVTLTVKASHRPTVQIDLPLEASTHSASQPVVLEGHVTDPDGVALTSLQWRSNLDGVLATLEEAPLDADGVSRYAATFSAGDHILTLAVTDDTGLSGDHYVHVKVEP
jgi:hypothetical protein